jgi:hypothetical protein
MKVFIKENTWLTRKSFMDFGWGNGYVVIPKGHVLNGKSYDEIHELIPNLKVNGGLTFSDTADTMTWKEIPKGSEGGWVIGFDTAHSWDKLENWSQEQVMLEVLNLKEQLQKAIPSSSFYWFFCFHRFFSSLFFPTKKQPS